MEYSASFGMPKPLWAKRRPPKRETDSLSTAMAVHATKKPRQIIYAVPLNFVLKIGAGWPLTNCMTWRTLPEMGHARTGSGAGFNLKT